MLDVVLEAHANFKGQDAMLHLATMMCGRCAVRNCTCSYGSRIYCSEKYANGGVIYPMLAVMHVLIASTARKDGSNCLAGSCSKKSRRMRYSTTYNDMRNSL